ncbi:MAG: YihY/virulence factor BrkB family protein [Chthoniobacteraceae bacterium]
MNLRALTPKKVIRLLKMTFTDWMEDNALRLSAALAYYSIFSIAPLLVIAISIAGLVLGDEAVRGEIGPLMQSYIGPQAAEAVQSMIQSASKPSDGWLGTIVGFVTLMLGASGFFGQLKDALNTIWEVKVVSSGGVWGFIRTRLLNFGMVLIIGFLLLTSLLLSTALAAFTGYFEHLVGLPPFIGVIFGFAVSFAVVALLFAVIFKVLPDAEIEWRHVWIGAIATALLFEIGKFGLSFYLGRESTASSFGTAGSAVLLLLWVYYASCILLFGAEFTQVYAQETGHAIQPAPGAVPVTAEARAQQGIAPASQAEDPVIRHPRLVPVVAKPVEPSPLRALLFVMGATFLIGILARRNSKKSESPAARLREDFADLGHDGVKRLEALWQRATSEAKRQKTRWL